MEKRYAAWQSGYGHEAQKYCCWPALNYPLRLRIWELPKGRLTLRRFWLRQQCAGWAQLFAENQAALT